MIAEEHVVTVEMMDRFTNGVFALVRSMENKQAIIRAISDSFVFDCDVSPIVLHSGNSGQMMSFILQSLLPKAKDPLRVIASTQSVLVKLRRPFRSIWSSTDGVCYNVDNPTGHYRLNLDSPREKLIAVELAAKAMHEYDDFKDIVNFKVIRNITWNGTKLERLPRWRIPDTGFIEFDYISPSRLPASDGVSGHNWTNFVGKFFDMYSKNRECHRLLVRLSSEIAITSAQLVELLSKFPDSMEFKCDLAVIFLRRVIDYPNLKEMLCRDRLGIPAVFSHEAVVSLENRVGKLALFNPLKIDNTTNDCDFGNEEDRCIAKTILKLLSKEKGSRLVNSKIGLTAAIPPKEWYSTLPDVGTWSCTYVVDEKGAHMKLRKELAVTLCGFDKKTVQ